MLAGEGTLRKSLDVPTRSSPQPSRPPTHAGGIVYRLRGGRREFLVVTASRNPEHWVLPKGHIEPGEDVETAALREVQEEAGVTARAEKSLGEFELRLGEEEQRIHYFLMLATREGGAREASRKIAWLPADDAVQRLSFPEAKGVLEKAIRELRGGSESKG